MGDVTATVSVDLGDAVEAALRERIESMTTSREPVTPESVERYLTEITPMPVRVVRTRRDDDVVFFVSTLSDPSPSRLILTV